MTDYNFDCTEIITLKSNPGMFFEVVGVFHGFERIFLCKIGDLVNGPVIDKPISDIDSVWRRVV